MVKELKLVNAVARDVSALGGKVYFVGGYVRDKILGKDNKDIDVEIYGLTLDQVKGVLRKYGSVSEVGASFGILMVKGYDVDFALPRTENSTGSKHTDFDIQVDAKLSVRDATKRRDFTMNALLQDVLTNDYIDLYGGVSDIRSKRIRYVDEKTFKEDELRVFRACQFSSRFNFDIDKGVIHVAQGFDYKTLSKERIYEELNKALLKSDKPSIAFNALYDMGVISKLFPELDALKGCEQSKEHHPEGDVWTHTMMVLDECAKLRDKSTFPLGLMYTGLCHDLGKPVAQEISADGKITFYSHEELGVPIAKTFLKRLTTDKKLIKYVTNLTEYHMKGHGVLEVKDSTLRKLFTQVDMSELLLITEADELGRGGVGKTSFDSKREAYIERISKLSIGEFGKVEPYLKGADLIKMGYKQGEIIGKTLQEAYQWQIHGDSKEKIERVLNNRINPRPKGKQVQDIIDEELLKLMGDDKLAKEGVIKRLALFQSINRQQDKVKFKLTEKRIPYTIVMAEDRKCKYLITPVFVLRVSLDNREGEVIFSTIEDTIENRIRLYKQLLTKVQKVRVDNLRYLTQVYGRLPNKI